MKKPPTFDDLKGFAVRHTTIADRDLVRYRVYRSEVEYIAVIADNALMAIKLSGIENPHKIVRDILHTNSPINNAMLREAEHAERVEFSLTQPETNAKHTFVTLQATSSKPFFEPMHLSQIHEKKGKEHRILAKDALLRNMHIDPMEYARATRSADAARMAGMPVEAQVAPESDGGHSSTNIEATVTDSSAPSAPPREEPPASTEEPAAQQAIQAEGAQHQEPLSEGGEDAEAIGGAEISDAQAAAAPADAPEVGELAPDEVARLLAEPRN
jgi:hypothetical protein